jgi:NAD(P)-dependent dehydrogenase (short-subunit alcohol dehydrogenase family)
MTSIQSPPSFFDLAGKVAVITGSSRGIGRAVATRLAESGAKVTISSRKLPDCEAVAAEINQSCGQQRAIAVAANISDKASLKTLVDQTQDRHGSIDILICNAASNPYFGPMSGLDDDMFRKILENNVVSTHWLISMVAPAMASRREGSIVIISSIGGFLGSRTIGAYNISKAADMQLARNMAAELGPSNIRVNAIAPGLIRTNFARALWQDPTQSAAYEKETALGRIGEPDDIAGAAVFLASRASAYLTGQTLVIDGGKMAMG